MRAVKLRRASCASIARTAARGARVRRAMEGTSFVTLERRVRARNRGSRRCVGGNSHAKSDVSHVANGHPSGRIELGRAGCERRRERAGGAARGRGDANNHLASIRPRARRGERTARSRGGARTARSISLVGWTDLVYFSWVADRQMQKRGERSVFERVGLRAASGNGSDELACDVCQVNPVYVMCHEDRAFLCRTCDVSIHSANGSAAKHQRFLFTNTRVELQALGAGEEVGRRTSPTDSAADHMVPQFEQEEVGRKVRFFRHGRRTLPRVQIYKEHQN